MQDQNWKKIINNSIFLISKTFLSIIIEGTIFYLLCFSSHKSISLYFFFFFFILQSLLWLLFLLVENYMGTAENSRKWGSFFG